MSAMVSQITSVSIVYSTAYSGADQSSASLAFVRGIHRWPVNSPHKGPVTRKLFPLGDVIIIISGSWYTHLEKIVTRHIFKLFAHNARRVSVWEYHSHSFPECRVCWLSILSFSLNLPFAVKFLFISWLLRKRRNACFRMMCEWYSLTLITCILCIKIQEICMY